MKTKREADLGSGGTTYNKHVTPVFMGEGVNSHAGSPPFQGVGALEHYSKRVWKGPIRTGPSGGGGVTARAKRWVLVRSLGGYKNSPAPYHAGTTIGLPLPRPKYPLLCLGMQIYSYKVTSLVP